MATIDLMNLIFVEILKISPSLLSQYYTIQDRIIHLLFLPHVILFLFLYGFGLMIVPPPEGNRGLRYLIVLAAYIVIIYQGWYGSFLIPLLQTWFYIMLFFGLFLFLVAKIFHPLTARKLGGAGTAIGQSIGNSMSKGKKIEALEDELKFVNQRISKLKCKSNNVQAQFELESYERQKHELKKEIKKLGG